MKISTIPKSLMWAVMVFAAGIMLLTQCTKKGENILKLEEVNAAMAQGDSIVFAQFYDSTVIAYAGAPTLNVNDVIRDKGILTIIQEKCGSANCHTGYNSYAAIKALVAPGSPESSKLWQSITTSDHNKSMPPVYNTQLSITEKVKIYNWIKNGAQEYPGLEDLRPNVMHLIISGCASVQCHNAGVLVGDWARRGLITVSPSDTTMVTLTNTAGTKSLLSVANEAKAAQIWGAYKDSVKKYYADPVANASFKPVKTVTRRSPFNNYDDIYFDIMYPKNARSRADYLNSTDAFVRRVDSTIIYTNQQTGANASRSGNMTYSDSHWTPSEIAKFKQWYFLDPNIPDVWKFGKNNQGIFTYYPSQTKITKK